MNFEYIDQVRKKAHITIDVSEYHGKISACLCCDNISAEDLLPEEVPVICGKLEAILQELALKTGEEISTQKKKP